MNIRKISFLMPLRWSRSAVLLLASVLAPFAIALAQSADVGAVGGRLREAIRAGELTVDQARAMMAALRQHTAGTAATTKGAPGIDRAAVLRRLRAAVESGSMTRAEARQKLVQLRAKAAAGPRRNGANARPVGGDAKATPERGAGRPMDLSRPRQRLEAAVESGQMTREEAARKLAAVEQAANKVAAPKTAPKAVAVDREVLGKRLRAAVESGRLTAAEARRIYAERTKGQSRPSPDKVAEPKGERRRR